MSRKRNKFLIALIILLVAAIIGTLAYIVVKNLNENNERKSLDNIAGSYASGIENGTTSATESATEVTSPSINVKKVENPIDFKSLQQQNSDIYSWIYIPNTNVNYPVLQSHLDDNLYLDHDIYKNYSFSGSIYSQMCNKRDYSDRVTVLYGHNMANGSMFATLHRFYDADFFNKNRYIYVYTPDRKLTYEIVSAFEYDNRHIMNSFDFSDDNVFSDYLNMIKNPPSVSVNKRNTELTTDDKILVLSTCLNSGDGRYLVQGVLKKDEPTK